MLDIITRGVREQLRTNRVACLIVNSDGQVYFVNKSFFISRKYCGVDQKFWYEAIDQAALRISRVVVGTLASQQNCKFVQESRIKSGAPYRKLYFVAIRCDIESISPSVRKHVDMVSSDTPKSRAGQSLLKASEEARQFFFRQVA